jgi:hypothetical protein
MANLGLICPYCESATSSKSIPNEAAPTAIYFRDDPKGTIPKIKRDHSPYKGMERASTPCRSERRGTPERLRNLAAVCSRSFSDFEPRLNQVRSSPSSRHAATESACRLCANTRHGALTLHKLGRHTLFFSSSRFISGFSCKTALSSELWTSIFPL